MPTDDATASLWYLAYRLQVNRYARLIIPNQGEHLVRYYGWYSTVSRGKRKKAQEQVWVFIRFSLDTTGRYARRRRRGCPIYPVLFSPSIRPLQELHTYVRFDGLQDTTPLRAHGERPTRSGRSVDGPSWQAICVDDSAVWPPLLQPSGRGGCHRKEGYA